MNKTLEGIHKPGDTSQKKRNWEKKKKNMLVLTSEAFNISRTLLQCAPSVAKACKT
jgi:hypothetical protein